MQRSSNSFLQITGLLGVGAAILSVYEGAPLATSVIQVILSTMFIAHGYRRDAISGFAAICTFVFAILGVAHAETLNAPLNWTLSITFISLALPFGLISASQLLPDHRLDERARIRQISGMFALAAALLAAVDATAIQLESINLASILTLTLVLSGALSLCVKTLQEMAARPTESYRRVSIFALGAAMCVAVVMWRVSIRQEQVRYNGLIADHLEATANKSQEILREATNALNRYSRRVAYLGFRDRKFLEIDSETYLKQLPILRRIGVVNPKFETTWSYPQLTDRDIQGLSQASFEVRKIAYQEAIRSKTSVLSSSLRLRSGDLGFILPTAIFKDEKLIGLVYGAIDAEKLFSKIAQSDEFNLVVYESGRVIYNQTHALEAETDFSQKTSVGAGLAKWELVITPTSAFFQKNQSSVPNEVLFGGILVAFVLAGIAHIVAREQNLNRVYTEWRNAILNGADYSIISTDANGVIQTFNKTAEKILQYRAGELVGLSSLEKLHDSNEAAKFALELSSQTPDVGGRTLESGFDAFIEKARSLGFAQEIECSYIRKDGTRCPVRLSITPLVSGEDQLDGYVYVATDMTEKKRIEAKLQTTVERLERVIKATGVGIWERDAVTKEIQFVDSRGKEIFGYGPDEELNYDRAASSIHPDDFKTLGEAMEYHVRASTPGFDSEFRIYNRLLKEERWVRATGQIAAVNGVSKSVVTTLDDVTVRVKNRKKLELALTEAETATNAKSAFLASMSHEIRTPLNGVIGMASLLLDSGLETTQLSYASVIYQSGNTLLRLINDILDFSKIEAGKMELEASPFDLASLIETQADLLIAKAQQKHISLSTFISHELDGMHIGDAGRISQILLNLISNSVKFTQAGGVLVSAFPVATDGEREMQWIRFEVRDTGIGVSPELAKKLFQPFVQADSSIAKRFGGTGLGLSISSRLVDLMGGKIGVHGVKDVGSTFWFEIPLPRVLDARDQGDANHESRRSSELGALSGRTALLIDDDPSVREVLGLYLRELGIEHVDATPGSKFALRQYDYVFFGDSMREPTREAVLLTLAETGAAARDQAGLVNQNVTSHIIVTPFGKKVDEARLNQTGIDIIVSKPVKRQILVDALLWDKLASQASTDIAASENILNPKLRLTSSAVLRNSENELEKKSSSIAREHIEKQLQSGAGETLAKLASPAAATSDPLASRSKYRILVADDNSINQIVARSILTKLGYTAVFVANGLEVLDMLQTATYDLILMDCQMPEMDGFEATRRVRAHDTPAIRDITIIALTANASENDSRQCFAAGMNDFLAKPIVAEDLDRMLTRWTSGRAEFELAKKAG